MLSVRPCQWTLLLAIAAPAKAALPQLAAKWPVFPALAGPIGVNTAVAVFQKLYRVLRRAGAEVDGEHRLRADAFAPDRCIPDGPRDCRSSAC